MKLKLQGKILFIVITLLCVLGLSTMIFARYGLTRIALHEIRQNLDGDAKLGYSLLDTKYPGPWKIEGVSLYKGDAFIGDGTHERGDYILVDEIEKQTGSLATIFMKNDKTMSSEEGPYMRVSTNVKLKDGSRAVGTYVSKRVADVIEKGEIYIGEAHIAGILYETQYTPIQDASGKTIGIWFVGVEKEQAYRAVNGTTILILSVNLFIILLGILFSILFIRRILAGIKKIVETIKEAENQNLTVYCDVKSTDEIGEIAHSLNNMIQSLKGLIQKSGDSAVQVSETSTHLSEITYQTTTAVEEVAKAIEDIAKGAMEQARNMEESMLQVNGLSEKIELVAGDAKHIRQISKDTADLTSKGLNTVEILTEKSRENASSAKEINEIVLEVDKRSQKIGTIVDTIGQIAQQTNLLALNASIEAARAGEHGRGFSVVAEEIRKLAEQSSKAVTDIHQIIDGIQNQSKSAVQAMDGAKKAVDENNRAVEETRSIFQRILDSVEALVVKIKEVDKFSLDMQSSKNELVNILVHLSAIAEETSASTEEVSASTQQQLASMEEITSSSQHLAEAAKLLQDEIKLFRI